MPKFVEDPLEPTQLCKRIQIRLINSLSMFSYCYESKDLQKDWEKD